MFFYINLTDQYQSAPVLPNYCLGGKLRVSRGTMKLIVSLVHIFLLTCQGKWFITPHRFLMVLVATARICDLPQVPQFEATEASNR